MQKKQKQTIRYSIGFKRQIVKEIEQGKTMESVRRRYGINGRGTIRSWLIKFGKQQFLNKTIRIETMEEKDRVKQLENEVKNLKLALADSLLAQRSLEVVIECAGKEYEADLKKNFGGKAFTSSKVLIA